MIVCPALSTLSMARLIFPDVDEQLGRCARAMVAAYPQTVAGLLKRVGDG